MAKQEETKSEIKPTGTSSDLVSNEAEQQKRITDLEGKIKSLSDEKMRNDLTVEITAIKNSLAKPTPAMPPAESPFWKEWLDELDNFFKD